MLAATSPTAPLCAGASLFAPATVQMEHGLVIGKACLCEDEAPEAMQFARAYPCGDEAPAALLFALACLCGDEAPAALLCALACLRCWAGEGRAALPLAVPGAGRGRCVGLDENRDRTGTP